MVNAKRDARRRASQAGPSESPAGRFPSRGTAACLPANAIKLAADPYLLLAFGFPAAPSAIPVRLAAGSRAEENRRDFLRLRIVRHSRVPHLSKRRAIGSTQAGGALDRSRRQSGFFGLGIRPLTGGSLSRLSFRFGSGRATPRVSQSTHTGTPFTYMIVSAPQTAHFTTRRPFFERAPRRCERPLPNRECLDSSTVTEETVEHQSFLCV